MPAPWLLAIGLVLALLVLIPARRLHLADIPARWIGWYTIALWLLAMAIAIRPMWTRVLVPFLIVAYLAPFVASPARVQRVLRRGRPAIDTTPNAPPMKDVTPPDSDKPPDDPDTPPTDQPS